MHQLGEEVELAYREILQARQDTELFRAGLPQGKTIIQLSVNMPGLHKCNEFSSMLIKIGMEELIRLSQMTGTHIETRVDRYSAMGPQSFFLTNQFAIFVKEMCLEIESTHILGKYLDFDVYSNNGKRFTRVMMGLGARKCYLCSKSAKECASRSNHSYDELLTRLVDDIELFEANRKSHYQTNKSRARYCRDVICQ